MNQKKLPVGIQEFEDIISEGYVYVDKTELIYRMITQGKFYFLSRPRRFGKSLLVSTLHAIFSGRRDLFKELWIDQSDWNWVSHPIIRLDMGTINNNTPEMLERALINLLNKIASNHKLILTGETSSDYLSDLIEQLSVNGKVVVLVDEYDKPILDQIDNLNVAQENRKILSKFYSVLKSQGRFLIFVLLTGITKFSTASIFSGLNNLNDITMSNDYSALLGFTKEELGRYFVDDIKKVASVNQLSIDDCYAQIKEWYNGYKFSEKGVLVYNPFSTLNLLDFKHFSPYWFETGTPTYLIELIKNRKFDLSNLEEIDVTQQSFTSFEIDNLHTLPILYQSGNLTIKGVVPEINAIKLGFPNREVNQAFSENLIKAFTNSESELNTIDF